MTTYEELLGGLVTPRRHRMVELPSRAQQRAETEAVIAAVERVTPEWWVAEGIDIGLRIIEERKRTGGTLTSNDLWKYGLSHPPGKAGKRAASVVMKRLKRMGLIHSVGRGAVSVFGHNADNLTIWRPT